VTHGTTLMADFARMLTDISRVGFLPPQNLAEFFVFV
jgi:hypothetical protein